MPDLSSLTKFLPLIIPVIVIELALFLFALVDIIRRPRTNGPKWMWIIICLFQIVGPIVYFIFGRKDE